MNRLARRVILNVNPRTLRRVFTQPPFSSTDVGKRQEDDGTAAKVDHSASSKLWEDAMREEPENKDNDSRNRQAMLLASQVNWTGEESMQDAVLRMLVDKYKPLRGASIRSAEEKLHDAPPKVSGYSSTYDSSEPILPGIEGHQPWHTTFKPPSHSVNVKLGNIPAPSTFGPRRISPLDDTEKNQDLSARRRTEQAARLGRARESLIDYRMGIGKNGQQKDVMHRRANPVSLKGWAGLIEERIERARSEGHFRTLKGRGKPLTRENEETNPFIEREEFLMNRIVQRNGAAPPWIELQTELETAVNNLRSVLRETWTRRAIRMLTLHNRPTKLAALTLSDITSFRDKEWEARERSYHNTAIDEVNSLVRRYNGVAPYAVRRAYHALEPELERAYKDSGEAILNGIETRLEQLQTGGTTHRGYYADDDDDTGRTGGSGLDDGRSGTRFWEVIKGWFIR